MTVAAPHPSAMPKQVCALNTLSLVSYLEERHPEIGFDGIVNEVQRKGGYHVSNIKTGRTEPLCKAHLTNPDYWLSNSFMMDLYEAIESRLPGDGLPYEIGRTAYRHWPIMRAAFYSALLGPRGLLQRLPNENAKFNRTKTAEVRINRPGFARIRISHFDGVRIIPFAMHYHAGIFHAYCTILGLQNIDITWKGLDPELKRVEFDCRYDTPSPWTRLVNAAVLKIPRVREALENAEAIQQEHTSQILDRERIIEEQTASLKAAQAQLLHQEQILTERHIAGGMAHEIRNTLGAAKLRLERALDEKVLTESVSALDSILATTASVDEDNQRIMVRAIGHLIRQQKNTAAIMASVLQQLERGLGITRRVMDYSQMEVPKNREHVDLAVVLDDLKEIYGDHLAQAGISLRLNLGKSLLASGPKNYLYAIFQNLILNARDAILSAEVAPGSILVTATRETDMISVEVSDNGCGIPDDDHERVFKPFYSSKPDTGMGLGLSECRKILKQLDGNIGIVDRDGYSTCFQVAIPPAGKTDGQCVPNSA